jgi:hypothetical protein
MYFFDLKSRRQILDGSFCPGYINPAILASSSAHTPSLSSKNSFLRIYVVRSPCLPKNVDDEGLWALRLLLAHDQAKSSPVRAKS